MNVAELLAKTQADVRDLEDRLGLPREQDTKTSAQASEVETDTETGEEEEEGQGSDAFSRFTEAELSELEALAQAGSVTAIQLLDKVEEEGSKGTADAGRRGSTRRKTSVAQQFNAAVVEGRGPHSAPRSINEARRRKQRGATAFN